MWRLDSASEYDGAMEQNILRKLAFTRQPQNTVVGNFTNAISVTVLDENGNPDTDFNAPIHVTTEDVTLSPDELKSRPPNATPKRLRATSPGCQDALSDIFFVLPK